MPDELMFSTGTGWVVVFYVVDEESDEIEGISRVHGMFDSYEDALAFGMAHWERFGEYDIKDLWS
jgi:hypothetical protein